MILVWLNVLCSRPYPSSIKHRYLTIVSNSQQIDTDLETVLIQLNKANYELSNFRTEAERTKLRFEATIRDRDTQILIEQKKSEDLQKDRKFLFEKQQSQATELLTLQDEYANYKVFHTSETCAY